MISNLLYASAFWSRETTGKARFSLRPAGQVKPAHCDAGTEVITVGLGGHDVLRMLGGGIYAHSHFAVLTSSNLPLSRADELELAAKVLRWSR